MAYTTLPTQSAGQTASAAGWANLVKADIESMGPHLVVRKSADESLSSNTTMQDDDDLLFALLANTTYQVRLFLLFTANATPGNIKTQWTMPSACSVFTTGWGYNVSAVSEHQEMRGTSSPTNAADWLGLATGGSSDVRNVIIEGVVINGANAGNLRLQWAQNSSSGTATTVKANSTLWVVQLA